MKNPSDPHQLPPSKDLESAISTSTTVAQHADNHLLSSPKGSRHKPPAYLTIIWISLMFAIDFIWQDGARKYPQYITYPDHDSWTALIPIFVEMPIALLIVTPLAIFTSRFHGDDDEITEPSDQKSDPPFNFFILIWFTLMLAIDFIWQDGARKYPQYITYPDPDSWTALIPIFVEMAIALFIVTPLVIFTSRFHGDDDDEITEPSDQKFDPPFFFILIWFALMFAIDFVWQKGASMYPRYITYPDPESWTVIIPILVEILIASFIVAPMYKATLKNREGNF